ncbi:rRNA methyltransferase 1, mitochondrial-like [Tubulanus polymorphus]|uniref:rRNA methyltransferase 1, mitochondrial-like n=1 Tax=Tubulanus polymorphus TaxID=672921 RepID=UPI003DA34AA7
MSLSTCVKCARKQISIKLYFNRWLYRKSTILENENKRGGESNDSGQDLLDLEAGLHRTNVKKTSTKNWYKPWRPHLDNKEKNTDVRFMSRKHAKQYNIQGEVLFGRHPVTLALKRKLREIYQLYISDQLKESEKVEIQNIIQLADQMSVPFCVTSSQILDKLSAGRPHQGICLDVSSKKYEAFDEESLSSHNINEHSPQLWLVLDRILDPMNLGAIIRSSYFFGVDRLLATKSSCRLSPVVCKASSGTMELVDVFRVGDLSHFIKICSGLGWDVVATSSSSGETADRREKERCVSLDDFHLDRNTIVIFGNEGTGLASGVLNLCRKLVYIEPNPGVSDNLESLNVSVSAGVLLHSLTRVRRKKDRNKYM